MQGKLVQNCCRACIINWYIACMKVLRKPELSLQQIKLHLHTSIDYQCYLMLNANACMPMHACQYIYINFDSAVYCRTSEALLRLNIYACNVRMLYSFLSTQLLYLTCFLMWFIKIPFILSDFIYIQDQRHMLIPFIDKAIIIRPMLWLVHWLASQPTMYRISQNHYTGTCISDLTDAPKLSHFMEIPKKSVF